MGIVNPPAPNDIKSSISLYLEGRLEKKGRIKDLSLDSAKIEDAVKKAFGTADIDAILESVRFLKIFSRKKNKRLIIL